MRPALWAFLLASLLVSPVAGEPENFPKIAGAKPTGVASLDGWAQDDLAAAFRTFQRSCVAIIDEMPALASAQPIPAALTSACRDALAAGEAEPAAIRQFLEEGFEAWEIPSPTGPGFLTGYYEPDFPGSLQKTPEFGIPLLARPDDLVALRAGDKLAGVPDGILGARRTTSGTFEPYPERGAIEDGALGSAAKPVVYLRDVVDAFIIQVQGSASIRLPDNSQLRVGFAGRNGHPYTSVARVLTERLKVPPAQMDADRLTAWLRANPAAGRELLRQNKSYVFFRVVEELTAEDGPVGGAGVALTAGRSLAVDRAVWPYGLPVWIEGSVPVPNGGTEPIRRLTVAQDTGSAITGPARADLFVGSGREAGARAGLMRHPARFVVLWPKTVAAAPPLRR